MEQAKAAISNIIGRGGQHDTTVDETINAPVTSETVKPTRHEETTTAVDKEVHKDHYHTTVQPLSHREVLPEQHSHQVAPVQEREIHHGDSSGIKQSIQAELGQFQDSSQTAQTTHTASQGATVAGEHVHHHVHEQVQPIIHKETVQPSVVHTVVPVHETHQAPSEHHGMSTLPVRSLDEFQQTGVSLTGASSRHETYQGDPRQYNPELQVERHDVDKNFKEHDGLHSGTDSGAHTTGGSSHTGTAAAAGVGAAAAGTAAAAHHHHSHHHGHHHETNESVAPKATAATVGQEAAIRKVSESPSATTATGSTVGGSSTLADSSTHTGTHHSHHEQHHQRQQHHSQHGTDSAHTGHEHVEGHGITNQQHHGTALDNSTRDDTVQHGDQPRDPAVVDEKSDKKLTGTGADGSHSAVFGLTPDGHKHDDTSHVTTPLKPAHSKETSDTTASTAPGQSGGAGKETVADQMTDPRVAEKGHSGPAVSTTDSSKPGAGVPSVAGSQGLGEVRPGEHGTESKLKDKIDPTTDADGDGKKGVMD